MYLNYFLGVYLVQKYFFRVALACLTLVYVLMPTAYCKYLGETRDNAPLFNNIESRQVITWLPEKTKLIIPDETKEQKGFLYVLGLADAGYTPGWVEFRSIRILPSGWATEPVILKPSHW